MTQATLGGFPLLASSTNRWIMREGVTPHVETFDLMPSDAETLLAQAGSPIDLVLSSNGKTVTIKRLYVLHAAPQDQPQIARVTVADRRWLWPNQHVLRRYNMRRNIGVRRVIDYATLEMQPVVQDVWYWPWSTKAEGIPWKAREILSDVLAELAVTEKDWSGQVMPIIDRLGENVNQTPVENLELNDNGANAMQRVLSYLPGIGIRVDADGSVVVYDKTKGGEQTVLVQVGAEVAGSGHVTLIDNRILRPRRCVVLFQREVETRFDFTESSGGTVAQQGDDVRYMQNVGQVTDPYLSVSGTLYSEGTWLTMDQFFGAWAIRNGFTLSHALVQKAFVPFFDLWADIVGTGEFDPSADWAPRVGMLRRCYRQVFRLNSFWQARILSLRAYRVATVDQATGTRAPAAVYADHAIIPSMRGKLAAGIDNQYFAINVDGYTSTITSETRPAPAAVEILDADQGIIGVAWKIDPLGSNEMILPSKITNSPNGDIRFPKRGPISFDSVIAGQEPPALSPSFKLAVILTAIPASPNTDQQLHKIVVTPDQAQPLIGNTIGPCDGPDLEIFIGPNICTAKIRWADGRSADIERCFGIGVGEPNLQGLILNDGPSSVASGASLNNVALAAAAQVYAALIDRPQGQQAGHLNGDVKLVGYTDSVSHEIDSKGVALTRVSMPGQVPRLTLAAYLDGSTRAAIFKLAQPAGKT